MKKYNNYLFISAMFLSLNQAFAQNPIITDQFTADPSARIFNGRVYVYPSHDIRAKEGQGRPGWFCMEDYHVFSSANLTDWTEHGVIVSQNKVGWVDSTKYAMWAPDCICKNGKYYFYFPAPAKDTLYGKGFSIGVAVSDNPYGPFIPEPEPILHAKGIDPCPFIDKDGQAYLYWSARNIYVARLNDNMTELASEPLIIDNLPEKGLKEGPFVFERDGIYYLTYPHVQNTIERLEYATGDNPMGPFHFAGVVMDESPMNCWTNQQSFIEYHGQWYLFYHQNALSPKFDKNRSICIDSLFFNDDGTIQKVTPTLRGVGVTRASQRIEIDRFSFKSQTGSSIEFLDSLNIFSGWKTALDSNNAWIQFNAVDFGNSKPKSVQVKAASKTGGIVQIRLDHLNGPLVSQIKIPEETDWDVIKTNVSAFLPGIHNLIVLSADDKPVEIDWIRFTE
jgi:hypothetical protein